ncbi:MULTISPECIES: response regulator transcription factor [unclassified Luteibacter]|uniref:LuxR C-terminal-related transcriptional regulator n=1 Tax=unclassified Luteibacter TaxID=2620188 RepID=UPI0008C4F99E|nr:MULTISPECIES: response regulator transcription factor [unclassified Luteibacter]MDR6938431.1 DNA-binding NarL/FixJ family response regulator [Luteibacter sp. 3190]SEP10561.1 DNA-binding response regulator, NarL/FixJ family, contains REC and HTH domains [Luteibacter sp. UNC138MFCol5.1]SEW05138.1 DNA-binding response regulator, NarL/FixJ family, contains REC and HTH domains [Luteibacter sp. 329MFSha]
MRVLIADDHRLIIEGVKLKLRELGDDVVFVEAETVAQLERVLATQPLPEVALIDMAMPGADGVKHIEHAVAALKDPGDDGSSRARPVIVLSGTEDPSAIRHVLDLGVQGYIPKSSPPDVILNAVRLVVGGGIYVPPEAMKSASVPTMAPAFASNGDGLTTKERLATVLTERQIDVLKLLAKGRPNKLIARELGISEGTVKIHLAAIFRALHVRNRLEALVAAQHLGD